MEIQDMPILNVQWIYVDKLEANDYNPNVVYSKEMELLKLSILKNGWIQPILATHNYVIIDGFHRVSIAKVDKKVREMTGGKVPVVLMTLSEPERMLLTIRINRAKGQHVAVKMSDIIKTLVNEYAMPIEEICRQIGATKDEIELLLMDSVFKKYDITKESKYSKAWIPNYDVKKTRKK